MAEMSSITLARIRVHYYTDFNPTLQAAQDLLSTNSCLLLGYLRDSNK